MRTIRMMIAVAAMTATGGCVRTAWNVATLPVKAVGKGADLMTTSAKERDEKYTRRMRKEQERRDKECRKHPDRCQPEGYGVRPDRSSAMTNPSSPPRN